MNSLVIVCGPTATGKTDVAVGIAQKFDGELVAADSRQVYRGMDIGTGKDKKALQGIRMWKYDVVYPDEPFSVSQYQKKAQAYIKDIQKRNNLPIIVGGTGFYIQSLVQSIPTSSIKPNSDLRKKLEKESVKELQQRVKHEYASLWKQLNESDRNNPHRLIRKIELGQAGMTGLLKPSVGDRTICWIGLTAPFPYLYQRIDRRVEKRVEEGVIGEVERLLEMGYDWGFSSLSGLGYREWKEFFKGKMTRDEVIRRWKFDEHAYARRQMTWFKRNQDIHWFDITHSGYREDIVSLVASWYTNG